MNPDARVHRHRGGARTGEVSLRTFQELSRKSGTQTTGSTSVPETATAAALNKIRAAGQRTYPRIEDPKQYRIDEVNRFPWLPGPRSSGLNKTGSG
jgi:hypothetical protein